MVTEFCDALKYDKAKKAFCGSEKKNTRKHSYRRFEEIISKAN